jgi:uncharacterized membrane protein YdjX (TVP38/TMEM64 family)
LGYLGIYVVGILCFIPSLPLSVIGGFLFGFADGGWTSVIGNTLGATLAFVVGRMLCGESARGWIVGHAKISRLDAALDRETFRLVVLSRLSPAVPSNLLNYAFALTRMRLVDFVWASLVGIVPTTLVYVYLGSIAADLAELDSAGMAGQPAHQALYWTGLAATLAVALIMARIGRDAWREAASPIACEQNLAEVRE